MNINVESYLVGELHAVEACGDAIIEAQNALKNQLKGDDLVFALLELKGIMIRASMLIRAKNKEVGIPPGAIVRKNKL